MVLELKGIVFMIQKDSDFPIAEISSSTKQNDKVNKKEEIKNEPLVEFQCQIISEDDYGDYKTDNSQEAIGLRRSKRAMKVPDCYSVFANIADRLNDQLIVKETLSRPEKMN